MVAEQAEASVTTFSTTSGPMLHVAHQTLYTLIVSDITEILWIQKCKWIYPPKQEKELSLSFYRPVCVRLSLLRAKKVQTAADFYSDWLQGCSGY